MTRGDLGAGPGEVHRTARAILDFWLRETPAGKRFARDDALDAEVARRFGATRDAILASGGAGWDEAPGTMLAAVIALDQFSRNIHRGGARAFAGDALARRLSDIAIARGWDAGMTAEERQFLYLPWMHSEDLGDQQRSVELYEALGDANALDFARRHREVIARFGRFPGRNAALGRVSTADETAFLRDPKNAF